MPPVKNVRLVLEPAAFAAIYEILTHVRLGGQNLWQDAIRDTLIAWEENGAEDLMDVLYDQFKGAPQISFTASDSDGVVLEIQ